MSNKQIIAAIILIVLIVSVVFVVGLVLQQPAQPNENPQDTTPPIVTILNPADGADLEALVRIDFNATDSNPITEYEIKIDSVTRTNLTSYEWDTTLETDGIHSIVCRAKDNSSNWGEDTISVTVNNTVLITNNAPIVTITAPAAFSTVFYGNVLITSTVVDEESLVANIYIDGEFVNDTGICVINASLLAHGVHSIFANATDSEGLTGSDLIVNLINTLSMKSK
jgi:hypothetical protein